MSDLTLNTRLLLASLAVGACLGAGWVSTPDAHAGLGCVHRGVGHVDKHGGQLEDDRFHIARGELPTCQAEEKRDEHHDDGDGRLFPHRDSKTHIGIREFF